MLSKIVHQETRRIREKGLHFLFAISLNILAIWLIRLCAESFWPTFMAEYENKDKRLMMLVVHHIVAWSSHFICFVGFYLLDKVPLFDQFKVVKDKLPWIQDPIAWARLRKRSILLNLFSLGIISPVLGYLDMNRTKISFSLDIPSTFQIVWQLYLCMTVQSILFYIFHKLGHEKLYRFHKVHHEFTVPCCLATNHFHPLDYIIGIIVPFAVGIKLLGPHMHFITYLIWVSWRILEGHDGHSNYEFPWSPLRVLPLSASAQYHTFHHTVNVGNFGSLSFVQDSVMGTNDAFQQFKKNQEANTKEEAKQK